MRVFTNWLNTSAFSNELRGTSEEFVARFIEWKEGYYNVEVDFHNFHFGHEDNRYARQFPDKLSDLVDWFEELDPGDLTPQEFKTSCFGVRKNAWTNRLKG